MSNSNETIHITDSAQKLESKSINKANKRSAAPSISLKPSRSFGRVKSLRPRTAVGIRKNTLSIEEFQGK
ncbi:hypothetical protein BIY24_03460 [Halobacteriovorax marinus]|nr:hypothetical protein [Halobacteriovorax marinus]ATH07025.1 hypothetical protein BIY24_03460 [Halobacteriovorax marinus]